MRASLSPARPRGRGRIDREHQLCLNRASHLVTPSPLHYSFRMPSIDMPLEQLRQYKPSLYREEDFESFWDSTIKEALRQPINAELVPYDLGAKNLECFAVRFDGFEGGRLAGWYVRPSLSGKFPGLCIYHGYSGRGTRLLDMIHLAAQGTSVLSMD